MKRIGESKKSVPGTKTTASKQNQRNINQVCSSQEVKFKSIPTTPVETSSSGYKMKQYPVQKVSATTSRKVPKSAHKAQKAKNRISINLATLSE